MARGAMDEGMKGLLSIWLFSCLLLVQAEDTQDAQFKRAPFNSWAGKRFDPSMYDTAPAAHRDVYGALGEYLSEALRLPVKYQNMDKRGQRPRAFSSWAGKRAPFSSWAGKRSGGSLERPEWYQEDYARRK